MSVLSKQTRRQLVILARRSQDRVTEFSADRPTDWRPGQVRNPKGILDTYFTESAAWDFIASKLENGHPVEVVELRKPIGTRGYVMKIDTYPDEPQIYVKLQLGSGKVIGRSFHYSKRED